MRAASPGRLDRLSSQFLRVGWLLPTLLPLTEIGGRALSNLTLGLYFLWGLATLALRRDLVRALLRRHGPALGLYAGVLVTALASLAVADDPVLGLHRWLKDLYHSMALVFTLAALAELDDGPRRLLRQWGIACLLLLGLLYLMLPFQLLGSDFEPTTMLREDDLPFLFCLAAAAFGHGRRWLPPALLAAVLPYVLLSEGRAALVGLLAGAWLLGQLNLRRGRWVLPVLLVLFLGGLVVLRPGLVLHSEGGGPSMTTLDLDRISSGRTELWRHAIERPPENPWLGIGLAQLPSRPEILTMHNGHQVQHLHNLLLDIWYETGWLGLTAWLALIGYALALGIGAWHRAAPGRARAELAAYLAASLALLTAAMFSFSYGSREISLYLMVSLAVLIHRGRRPGATG